MRPGVLRGYNALFSRVVRGRHECVICGRSVLRFLPYRGGVAMLPPLMRALEVCGSDVENFGCPWCGAHDRERHLWLYLRESQILSRIPGSRVMHFAPETHLARLIQDAGPAEYVKCDIIPRTANVTRVDLMEICFPAGSFDVLIANHVMEHVADDCRALSEIARVLKPGGYAILQTPYSPVLEHTWEDVGIVTEEARLHAYGQEDHVRLFGRDVFARFARSGLESHVTTHDQLLGGYSAGRYGLNAREPFFLYRKGADA